MNLNKIFILGRLTRDPEQRTMPSGKAISNFGMATNRVWTNQESGEKQEQVEFHNIVAFGRLAEICNQYLTKGQLILIEGRIQTRSWEDQGGNKRYRTEVVAENMQMGPKSGGGRSEEVPEASEAIDEVQVEESEEEEKSKSKKKKPAKGPLRSLPRGKAGEASGSASGEIDVKDIPF